MSVAVFEKSSIDFDANLFEVVVKPFVFTAIVNNNQEEDEVREL